MGTYGSDSEIYGFEKEVDNEQLSQAPSVSSTSQHDLNVRDVDQAQANLRTLDKCQYLKQLLQDKNHLQTLLSSQNARTQSVKFDFNHLTRLLDEEIIKIRSILFKPDIKTTDINSTTDAAGKFLQNLPKGNGKIISLTEKIWVPIKDSRFTDYNFVGRILGPRGLTAKQLEQETDCKIMVRGEGSIKDKKIENYKKGKQNWEHLSDPLHVLINVEDYENRAKLKMEKAKNEVEKLLMPKIDGEDGLKKKQLMELAIINGTYRDTSIVKKVEVRHHKSGRQRSNNNSCHDKNYGHQNSHRALNLGNKKSFGQNLQNACKHNQRLTNGLLNSGPNLSYIHQNCNGQFYSNMLQPLTLTTLQQNTFNPIYQNICPTINNPPIQGPSSLLTLDNSTNNQQNLHVHALNQPNSFQNFQINSCNTFLGAASTPNAHSHTAQPGPQAQGNFFHTTTVPSQFLSTGMGGNLIYNQNHQNHKNVERVATVRNNCQTFITGNAGYVAVNQHLNEPSRKK